MQKAAWTIQAFRLQWFAAFLDGSGHFCSPTSLLFTVFRGYFAVVAYLLLRYFFSWSDLRIPCEWTSSLSQSSVHFRSSSIITESSAIADGPRDATCQSNSCQLLRNSVGTTYTISPEQIEVMELEGYSRPTYNKLEQSSTTRSTIVGAVHKLTVDEFTSLLITPAKFSKSTV